MSNLIISQELNELVEKHPSDSADVLLALLTEDDVTIDDVQLAVKTFTEEYNEMHGTTFNPDMLAVGHVGVERENNIFDDDVLVDSDDDDDQYSDYDDDDDDEDDEW